MAEPAPQQNREKPVEDIFGFSEAGQAQPTPEQRPPVEQRPEQAPQPEHVRESRPEQRPEGESARRTAAAPIQPMPAPVPATPVVKDPAVVEIEGILSEHLEDLFLAMDQAQQMAFQQKGEETASKINVLLGEAKVKVREILSLIREWLQMIPGVNKFFIEQEAKIKTDRLLNAREQKNRNQH
ncbi:MAG: hypothetical protein HZC01_00525 [Candidatus Kerfeldbacteria bacterium]|nr:hypothetical protein [Candidatus Kerfeldbacteria bacterium]